DDRDVDGLRADPQNIVDNGGEGELVGDHCVVGRDAGALHRKPGHWPEKQRRGAEQAPAVSTTKNRPWGDQRHGEITTTLGEKRMEIVDKRAFLLRPAKSRRLQRNLVVIHWIARLPDQLLTEATGNIGEWGKLAAERVQQQHTLWFSRGRTERSKKRER